MAYTLTAQDMDDWGNEVAPTAYASPVTPNTPANQALASQGFMGYERGNWQDIKNEASNFEQGILGAGDALRNTLASSLGLLQKTPVLGTMTGAKFLPQDFTTPVQSGSGTPYTEGNFLGNIGAFMGGGELADTARMGAEAIPYAGKAAQWLGGQNWLPTAARQALGSAAYGGLAANNNRMGNAGVGAGLSLAASAIPPMAQLGVKGAQYFMPQRYLNQLLDNLGGGQTLQDATQSVLGSIGNAYQTAQENSRELYNPIFNRVANSPLYAKISGSYGGLGTPAYDTNALKNYSRSYTPVSQPKSFFPGLEEGNYQNYSNSDEDLLNTPFFDKNKGVNLNPNVGIETGDIAPNISSSSYTSSYKPQNPAYLLEGKYPSLSTSTDITDNYSSSIKGLHNDFIQNPTFQNAHDLQSALGVELNQVSKSAQKTKDVRNEISSLGTARSALQDDMLGFLNNFDPNRIDNTNISPLAQQYLDAGQDFKSNVAPYRNNPSIYSIASGDTTNLPPASLAGIFKAPDADMLKVISDLPSNTMDKVLYTQLGKDTPSNNPMTFLRHADRLDEQGLGNYISPELQSQIDSLRNRVKLKSLLQSSVSGALGAAEGARHGMGPAIGMGLTAATFGSPFMNYLSRRLPLEQIGNAISTGIQKIYGPLRTTALATTLNKSGVPNNGT